MPKIISIHDNAYDELVRISKLIDISRIDNNMRILNNQDEPLLESKNDVLFLATFICGITGRVHKVYPIDEVLPVKKRKYTKKLDK